MTLRLTIKYLANIYKEYGINLAKQIIVAREEEYRSSYVSKKFSYLYEALKDINNKLDVNVVVIPRYNYSDCKKDFPFAIVLDKRIKIQHLLAKADLFIGGGGTINSEACFLGTPTISTRSFISHYDKYQIDNKLMHWAQTKDELVEKSIKLIGKRIDKISNEVLNRMSVDIKKLVIEILG